MDFNAADKIVATYYNLLAEKLTLRFLYASVLAFLIIVFLLLDIVPHICISYARNCVITLKSIEEHKKVNSNRLVYTLNLIVH